MIFLETPVFTRAIDSLVDRDEFAALQMALHSRPERGALIPGTGGLRKMRWSRSGSGKRGGIRVIYHYHEASDQLYLLYAYSKSAQEDLTAKQLDKLSRLVREEFQ